MSYMDYNQFKAIMAENGYQKSKAVDVYLNKAMHYHRLAQKIVANTQDKEPVVRLKMEKFVKKYDDARIEAVWDAINVAKLEKYQGWRFIEDGDEFILQLQIKYQGNMKQATEFEQKQVELSTLYEQAYKEIEKMNRLRQVRKTKGITLKEVAEDTEISENLIGKYEREEREPRRKTWIKLADYYCVPVSYLMGLPDGLVQHINKSQSMTFEELHEAVIQWANDRNMIKQDKLTALSQLAKVTEEHGKLSAGINKKDEEKIKDSLGDSLVTLIILAQDLDFDLLDCLNEAYNVIKDRKGKVIDGSYIKESDLHE